MSCTPSALCDIAGKDRARLQVAIAHKLIKNPFVDCISGGYTGEHSMKPVRGEGPHVPINRGYSGFKFGYLQAQISLENVIVRTLTSDIQTQFLLHGRKANLVGADSEETKYTWGMKFHPEQPTRGIRWADLEKAAAMLSGDKFSDATVGRVIGDPEVITQLLHGRRTRIPGNYHYNLEKPCYQWEIDLDSNLGFGFTNPGAAWPENKDQLLGTRSLRAAEFYPSGHLRILADTKIQGESTCKTISIADDWLNAPLSVLFVVGPKALRRRVINTDYIPTELAGHPHLYHGRLWWHYAQDGDLNIWGDWARHNYEIERNYAVAKPDNIIAILYRREIFQVETVTKTQFV